MRRRGIVLLISIVLAVVMIMFIGAAIGLGPASLSASQSSAYHDQAQWAAESGVHYALSQLHQDSNWRGDKNKVTVNSPDLYVVEDNGNVVGLLTCPDGSKSQFRLRFNYNDGAGGGDGLPNSALSIDEPYVSVNNLSGGTEADVPRADGPNASVTAASAIPFKAPIWACSLAVEGRAGRGMDAVTPANLNPANLPGSTRVVVEGIYQVPDLGPDVQDTALMAAGGFRADLEPKAGHKVILSSKNKDGQGQMRSKGTVEVSGGDPSQNLTGDKQDLEIRSSDGNLNANYDSTKTTVKQEQLVDPFYQLVWNDVKKPDPTGPKWKAGTYVWWDDGSLHYYDMNYSDYASYIQSNPTDPGVVPAPLPAAVQVVKDKKKLGKITVTDSVTVEEVLNPDGSTKTNDLSLLIRQGAAEIPPDGSGAVPPGGGAQDLLVDQVSTTIISQGSLQKFIEATQTSGTASNGRFDLYRGGQFIGMVSWNPDGQGGKIVNSNGDLNMVLNTMMMSTMYPGYTGTPTNMDPIDVNTVAQMFGIVPGKPTGELNLPGVTDTLTANDIEIEFNGGSKQVVLYGDGDIRLTGGVRGKGGSIVAGGDLRITGMGADFSSFSYMQNADGVNMYARGDIVFNTLDKNGSNYEFQDIKLKGIVYAWGDFMANLGSDGSKAKWGNLEMEGTLIAYGGDPAGKPATDPGKGRVDITAGKVKLTFDPAYAGALTSTLPPGYRLKPISWANNLP